MAKKKDTHYIRERTLKNGSKVLLIEIRAYGMTFRQSLKVDEYGGLTSAYKVARSIRDKKIVEMREGKYVKKMPTVGDLYHEKFSIMRVRVATKAKHDDIFERGIKEFEDIPIDQVSAADIQKSVNVFATTHTYDRTKRFLTIWRQIYKCAAMKELPISDKTLGVTINRSLCIIGKKHSKDFSKSDYDMFCETLLTYKEHDPDLHYRSQVIYYAIQLMEACGMQPAEVYALTRNDFHITEDVPYITVTKCVGTDFYDPDDAEKEYEPVIRAPKTEYRSRSIPITDVIVDLCETILEWSHYDLVFADFDGSILSGPTIGSVIYTVSQLCGIRFNQYMLRHSFSTDLFREGVSPAVIRDLMGHTSRTVAQTIDYATSSEQDKAKAMDERKRLLS